MPTAKPGLPRHRLHNAGPGHRSQRVHRVAHLPAAAGADSFLIEGGKTNAEIVIEGYISTEFLEPEIKAEPDQNEINILRGILASLDPQSAREKSS